MPDNDLNKLSIKTQPPLPNVNSIEKYFLCRPTKNQKSRYELEAIEIDPQQDVMHPRLGFTGGASSKTKHISRIA